MTQKNNNNFSTFSIFIFILVIAQCFASSNPIFKLRKQHNEGIPVKSTTLPPTIGPQYSGLLSVNQTFNGELFYWFFQTTNANAPIIVWLEGGPGIPSSFQVFYGMGPYRISNSGEVTSNPESWNNNFNLLFIDNPLGVGFSSVNTGGFAVNEEEVARTLYTGLLMFFELYPQFQSNDLYVFGESYGGKYVPALSFFIYYVQNLINEKEVLASDNDQSEVLQSFQSAAQHYYTNIYKPKFGSSNIQLNFKGLGIGDGLVDTPVQINTLADFAYFHGLSSLEQRNNLTSLQNYFQVLYSQGEYEKASNAFWDIIYFIEYGDTVNIYNVDCSLSCGLQSYMWGAYSRFLNQASVKEQLNVPTNYTFDSQSGSATSALNPDVCKSVADLMPTLFSNYPTILYQGTLDLICNAAGNDLWLSQSKWSGMSDFQNTKKQTWFDGFDVAGYLRSYSNLTQIVLPNAGHFVPMDQPYRSNLMVYNWIYNIPFQTSVLNRTISYDEIEL